MNCRTSDVDPELGILKWPIQGIIEERISLPERKLLTLLTRDVGRTLLPFFFGFVLVKVTHHLMLKKALALELMTNFFFFATTAAGTIFTHSSSNACELHLTLCTS